MENFNKECLLQVQNACTPQGLLASTQPTDNYARIWARDSVMSGLSGLLTNDDTIIEGLKNSLFSLSDSQGPQGEIPSNVAYNAKGEIESISYGTIAGRVDAPGWFIIGACLYLMKFPEHENRLLPHIESAVNLYNSWEFNQRGLVYTPQGGNWADDYYLEGYLLYDQLIRLWALKCYKKLTDSAVDTEKLKQLIQINYWPSKENISSSYHKRAYENICNATEKNQYWLAGFKPGGYFSEFDLFANALSLILNINSDQQQETLINYVTHLYAKKHHLAPAFYPIVGRSHPKWGELQNIYGPKFKNNPNQYHNGGLWPMLNGWWALALSTCRKKQLAENVLKSLMDLHKYNESNFYEYYHGLNYSGAGTKDLTWSAALPLMASLSLNTDVSEDLCVR